MKRDKVKHWNVSMTYEDLYVTRKVFADYVTEQLNSGQLNRESLTWLREVDRVGRKLAHTGPRD